MISLFGTPIHFPTGFKQSYLEIPLHRRKIPHYLEVKQQKNSLEVLALAYVSYQFDLIELEHQGAAWRILPFLSEDLEDLISSLGIRSLLV